MKIISAAKFKEECLALLDRLDPEGLLITKRGKPVARLTSVTQQSSDLIGVLKGKLKIKGDTFSTGVKWNAQS
ncbi:MAG: type II toxin-antitoxin system Phd/YefM family antitoxin [SAR324 cluster bacterium]|uniref:Type II toxin-antitoxin system Phd/YefM family antitoxin n=1 Tax=SAR324 cluster bacterium TaxID=2024889 RepID=A0A7X9FPX0_9DELT|nr:type II toxin-antitoxin system Phd/YefM family antitoxin [SAR324 cluster bacterium]